MQISLVQCPTQQCAFQKAFYGIYSRIAQSQTNWCSAILCTKSSMVTCHINYVFLLNAIYLLYSLIILNVDRLIIRNRPNKP